MSRLNRHGYQVMVDLDLAWLDAMPRSLERDHIIEIVKWSVGALYPDPPSAPGIDAACDRRCAAATADSIADGKCQSNYDGECDWKECPQLVNYNPRGCPRRTPREDD